MNSYILLRDNKESSSLSIGELKQMGLRSTDLIWVECQSVSWRYPHEISELKDLMAVRVKAVADTTLPLPDQSAELTGSSTGTVEKPVVENIPVVENPIKVQQEEAPGSEAYAENLAKYGRIDHTETVIENEASTVHTNYSRPLDEIKEVYARKLAEQGRLQKNSKTFQLPKGFKKIAVYIGFAVTGALIMVLISNSGKKKIQGVPQNKTVQPVSTPAGTDAETPEEAMAANEPIISNEDAIIPKEEKTTVVEEEKRIVIPAKTLNDDKRTVDPVLNSDDEPGEKTRPATEPVKMIPVENLSSQVSVKPNDYVTGSFGGIRNLEMTLQNDSKYVLDKVMVEIKYLNLDNIIVHAETIQFKSVQPGKPETIAVKKSRRGQKISFKIIRIEPKETDDNTAGF